MCISVMTLKSQVAEFKVGSNVYLVDEKNKTIINKGNTVYQSYLQKCTYFSTKDDVDLFYPSVKKSFPEKMIKSFAKTKGKFFINVFCDSSGEIKEVYFLVKNIEISSEVISSINTFERLIKQDKINLSTNCEDQIYYRLTFVLRFNNLNSCNDE